MTNGFQETLVALPHCLFSRWYDMTKCYLKTQDTGARTSRPELFRCSTENKSPYVESIVYPVVRHDAIRNNNRSRCVHLGVAREARPVVRYDKAEDEARVNWSRKLLVIDARRYDVTHDTSCRYRAERVRWHSTTKSRKRKLTQKLTMTKQ